MRKLFLAPLFVVVIGLVLHHWRRQPPGPDLNDLQLQMAVYARAAYMFSTGNRNRLPSAARWPMEVRPHLTSQARYPPMGFSMNAALAQRDILTVKDPLSAVLFFQSPGPLTASLDAIPKKAGSGKFAVTFLSGNGYPRSISEREKIIA